MQKAKLSGCSFDDRAKENGEVLLVKKSDVLLQHSFKSKISLARIRTEEERFLRPVSCLESEYKQR